MDSWCWIERFSGFTIKPTIKLSVTPPVCSRRSFIERAAGRPLPSRESNRAGAARGAAAALLLCTLAMLAGCSSKPDLPTYGSIPEFQLTDQTGAPFFSAQTLKGRVWVADFIFTNCPGPCPRMSSQMHQVQTALKGEDGLRLVSFTIDPARDTPPVLAAYSKHFVAEAGRWYFLTGPVPSLNHLAKDAFHLSEIDGKSLDHSTRLALVDRSSQIRGYYLSSDQDAIPNLIADARRLLQETE
jgi:protein SCO1